MNPPSDPFSMDPSFDPSVSTSPIPDLSGGATVVATPRRLRRGCAIGSMAGVFFVLIGAIAFTALLTAIWPGAFKLTGSMFCPDGYDDVLVVRDTYQAVPGETTTTFTTYCMNERGEVTDIGVLRPMLVVYAAVVVVFLLAFALLAVFVTSRVKRRARATGSVP